MSNAIDLLKRSIDRFAENWKLFVGIALVPGLLTFASGMLLAMTEPQTSVTPMLLVLGMQFVLVVVGILMSIALIRAVMQPMIGVQEAYRQALPYFWWYLLLSIVVGLVVMVGFILLIIPGIIFMVWFAFTYYALVVDNVKGFAAMKRSKELVSGRWWSVFGYVAFLILVSLLVGMVVGALSGLTSTVGAFAVELLNFFVTLVVTPIALIYFYLLYEKLKASDVAAAPSEAPREQVPPHTAPSNVSPEQGTSAQY